MHVPDPNTVFSFDLYPALKGSYAYHRPPKVKELKYAFRLPQCLRGMMGGGRNGQARRRRRKESRFIRRSVRDRVPRFRSVDEIAQRCPPQFASSESALRRGPNFFFFGSNTSLGDFDAFHCKILVFAQNMIGIWL